MFQQKILGSTSYFGPCVSFDFGPWAEYKAGFGNFTVNAPGSGFWLGLERMRSGHYMLRVEIGWYNGWTSMEYDIFQLESEAKSMS